jgi:hypothetical protein
MRNSRLIPTLLGVGLTAAPARSAPVVDAHPMATQAGCPANVGVLNMSVDVFGAFGSGVPGAGDANYDPVDAPDQGVHGTVFEAMTFMCYDQGGVATGNWLELARQNGVNYIADGTPNHMTSSFSVAQVDVALDARLDCNVLTLCYTMTNRTGARIDNLVLLPYLDGDLFFNGRFNNDYAATNAGQPRTVYEFDQGDDPAAPTTYLAMFGTDPADPRLSGWETAQYNEGQARVQDTFNGCNTLRNGLTRRVNTNADLDANLVTDAGFDVSLALRYSAGALAPNAASPPMCFNIQWGQGRQCSDEDHDNVCVPQDNCPAVANPTQTDSNGNGIGDACEVMCVPVAETCNGLDDDCDATADDGNPGGGAACNTGAAGACAAGTTTCSNGALRCNATNQPAAETCNGVDDDCDGRTDQNAAGQALFQPCYAGPNGTLNVGVCRAGTQTCAGGAYGACAGQVLPVAEVCDGLDNDCDGAVDDNLGLGNACAAGVGACRRNGVNVCGAGGALSCNAVAGAPVAELCDGLDNDCDGAVDDGEPGGGAPCVSAQPGVCASGRTACVAGAIACRPLAQPTPEVCDSLDNDCNGRVDDVAGNACACAPGTMRACYSGPAGTQGVGRCRAGTQVCAADGRSYGACAGDVGPAVEVCNAADDDCDGLTDDAAGVGDHCTAGLGACERRGHLNCDLRAGAVVCDATAGPAGAEVCNGLDDDCDGQTDDGLDLGAACEAGLGVCRAVGVRVCDGAGAVACSAVPGRAGSETCDGRDDDCDGEIDEGDPGGGVDCPTGDLGACATGVTHCRDGAPVCDAVITPEPEVCNGLDDDCNGEPDDDPASPDGRLFEVCFEGAVGLAGIGRCAEGRRHCLLADFGPCEGQVLPEAETCNAADDDCNGRVDDLPGGGVCLCAPGDVVACYSGPVGTAGVGPCAPGIQVCRADAQGYDACQGEALPGVEACNGLDDDCDGSRGRTRRRPRRGRGLPRGRGRLRRGCPHGMRPGDGCRWPVPACPATRARRPATAWTMTATASWTHRTPWSSATAWTTTATETWTRAHREPAHRARPTRPASAPTVSPPAVRARSPATPGGPQAPSRATAWTTTATTRSTTPCPRPNRARPTCPGCAPRAAAPARPARPPAARRWPRATRSATAWTTTATARPTTRSSARTPRAARGCPEPAESARTAAARASGLAAAPPSPARRSATWKTTIATGSATTACATPAGCAGRSPSRSATARTRTATATSTTTPAARTAACVRSGAACRPATTTSAGTI